MGKVYLICGKICSGKSYYAKALKEKYNAVILSTDEATEICKAGANVILDWGFWTKENRSDISAY